MSELPPIRTFILEPPRTFQDVKDLAEAQAAADGLAVTVDPVEVDGKPAARVAFSRPAMPAAALAQGAGASPAGAALALGPPPAAAGAGLSPFARQLAAIATREFDDFHQQKEGDPGLSKRIKQYWTELGLAFPGVSTPWSAVFVSFCVKTAGASASEFAFAPQHSVFVKAAIDNAKAGRGVFRGVPVDQQAPAVGDIIQNNRGGSTFNFDFAAKNANYASHSAIVVETGRDTAGRFAITIGGNESDSVGRRRVKLDANGMIVQRAQDPFICLVRNLK